MHHVPFAKITIVLVVAFLSANRVKCHPSPSENLENPDSKTSLNSRNSDPKTPENSINSEKQTLENSETSEDLFINVSLSLGSPDSNFTNASKGGEELDRSVRIVNGDDVNLGHLPFMVRLLMQRNGAVFVCGGSLLTEHWVLTAAHCVTEDMQMDGSNFTFVMDGNRIMVKAGDVSLDEVEHSQEDRYVTQVYLHPQYHPWYLKADIALLYIKEGFYFTQYSHSNIDIVQIASVLPPAGTTVTVAGWGKQEDGELARLLQMNSYLVPDQEACRIHYASLGYHLAAGMWCTGDYDMTSHSAQGDSGGPVFVNNGGIFTQYGLVSWGIDMEEVGSHDFDVNADVPFYKPWIEETLESHEESRHDVYVSAESKTATIKKAGLGYFLINVTCDEGYFIKVDFLQLSLSWDMSHVIVRDGPYYNSKLLLQQYTDNNIQDIGVTSSSNKMLIIIRTSMSSRTKTVKFTFRAVQSRGENTAICADSMELCKNGLLCYDAAYQCDANWIADCPDGSDEEDCPGRPDSEAWRVGVSWGVVLSIALIWSLPQTLIW